MPTCCNDLDSLCRAQLNFGSTIVIKTKQEPPVITLSDNAKRRSDLLDWVQGDKQLFAKWFDATAPWDPLKVDRAQKTVEEFNALKATPLTEIESLEVGALTKRTCEMIFADDGDAEGVPKVARTTVRIRWASGKLIRQPGAPVRVRLVVLRFKT